MSDAANAPFFPGYYRYNDPMVASQALEGLLLEPSAQGRDTGISMFIRAVQLHPEIRPAIEKLAREREAFKAPIAHILKAVEETQFPDPETMPITKPADLDVLWREFLLTGDPGPVERICAVVTSKDRSLEALTQWVSKRPWTPWGKAKYDRVRTNLGQVGIQTDPARERLGNELDVDLLVCMAMTGGFQVKKELPFQLSEEFLYHLALKGAACWSLQSNAQSHDRVAKLYRSTNVAMHPRFM